MEKIKATILTKRILKSFWCKDKYMLGLQFYDIYNNKRMNVLKWLNPFHYWRLLFGDKSKYKVVEVKFK